MCPIRLLIFFSIWFHNQILSFASQTYPSTLTTSTTITDLQDGHPNHQLWQKMIDTGRTPSPDWYVINFHLFILIYFVVFVCFFLSFLFNAFRIQLCHLIKLVKTRE